MRIVTLLPALLLPTAMALAAAGGPDFLARQLHYERVRAAKARSDASWRALHAERGLPYPPPRLFMRAFKHEGLFELWAAASDQEPYQLLRSYPICAASGVLGPKRRQGDLQVPEGFYRITAYNPASAYHLGMLVDYPNPSDRARSAARRLGGEIMVHGDCVTIGCIPLTDATIEEVYWLAIQVQAATGQPIPIHIFPARLSDEGLAALAAAGASAVLLDFWRELQPGYRDFEEQRRLPRIRIGRDGRYRFSM